MNLDFGRPAPRPAHAPEMTEPDMPSLKEDGVRLAKLARGRRADDPRPFDLALAVRAAQHRVEGRPASLVDPVAQVGELAAADAQAGQGPVVLASKSIVDFGARPKKRSTRRNRYQERGAPTAW